jgi:hypothetical protein
MLPMQHITQLPLLIAAVLTRLNQTDDEYTTCQLALATLNKVSEYFSVVAVDKYIISASHLYLKQIKCIFKCYQCWEIQHMSASHWYLKQSKCILYHSTCQLILLP